MGFIFNLFYYFLFFFNRFFEFSIGIGIYVGFYCYEGKRGGVFYGKVVVKGVEVGVWIK